MPIANFEYPINLYGDTVTIEDWLANFTVETNKKDVERYPQDNIALTVSEATFFPTKLGELEITREMLVAMFTDEAVRKMELDVALAYLEGNTL